MESQKNMIFTFTKKDGETIYCRIRASLTLFQGTVAIQLFFALIETDDELEELYSIGDSKILDGNSEHSFSSASSECTSAIDPAVVIHIRAFQRAAKASRRHPRCENGKNTPEKGKTFSSARASAHTCELDSSLVESPKCYQRASTEA